VKTEPAVFIPIWQILELQMQKF